MSNLNYTENKDLLDVINSIVDSLEFSLSKNDLMDVVEISFTEVVRCVFGHYPNVVAVLNKSNCSVKFIRKLSVCDEVTDSTQQIDISDALAIDPEAVVGAVVEEILPPFDMDTNLVRTFKSVLYAEIKRKNLELEYQKFLKFKGTIMSGVVRRINEKGLLVVVGKTECTLPTRFLIPQEVGTFKIGSKVNVLIKSVEYIKNYPQIILSRTDDEFLLELLKQEISEISDGKVDVKAVARDAGSRSKVVVDSSDKSIDPVGVCIGFKGKRVAPITVELKNERIDIVQWSNDPAKLVMSCLKGVDISKVEIDDKENVINIVVPDSQISLAIGRGGQNVRLISRILVRYRVNILSDEEDKVRRTSEFELLTQALVNDLEVDEIIAQLLISEGYKDVEKIANSDLSAISSIQGFNEDVANEIRSRAIESYKGLQVKAEHERSLRTDFAKKLSSEIGINERLAMIITASGVASQQELADYASDELLEKVSDFATRLSFNISQNDLDDVILKARKHLSLI